MDQPTSAPRYRVGQFLRALAARVSEEEVEQAIRILTPEARALFRCQAVQDQHHALVVYHALRQAGHTNPQLLAAALLHDVGKAAARLPAWQRAVIVLLEHFAPCLLARLSQGEPRGRALSLPKEPALPAPSVVEGSLPKGWSRPCVVHARHPEVGSRWAREAGCTPLTIALIRRHQDRLTGRQTEEDQLLAALQAADNLN
ncbi:MAG: hypothetical protein V3T90_02645 [Anaerolineae bacterium]